jgi:hypothetical protein
VSRGRIAKRRIAKPRIAKPTIARFLAKVRAPLAEDGTPDPFYCWIWTGAMKRRRSGPVGWFKLTGLGPPGRRGLAVAAPRIALALKTGTLHGPEMQACHTSECPSGGLCVNWYHLYWGTVEDNIRDHERDYGKWGRQRKYGKTVTTHADGSATGAGELDTWWGDEPD